MSQSFCSPRVQCFTQTRTQNLPAWRWLLFTLIHSKVSLFTSTSARLQPETAVLPTATWISGPVWPSSATDPKPVSSGSLLLFDARYPPHPGESCPCALHRQGTREEWGQAGAGKPSRVVLHGGSGGAGWGGGLSREVHKVKLPGRTPYNPGSTPNSSRPSSSRLVSSGSVPPPRSRFMTSFARQQPVNRGLLSPPAVNSW